MAVKDAFCQFHHIKATLTGSCISDVMSGKKKALLHPNDRHFLKGDVVALQEWIDGKFTEQLVLLQITSVSVIRGFIRPDDEWAVISIRILNTDSFLSFVTHAFGDS